MPLLILLFIAWYSCYITLTKFPYKFAKHMQRKFISSQKPLHKQFPSLCKVPALHKAERLAPWDIPAVWGLCFWFYFLHSSPQALFSFPCLVSWIQNTTLILIQEFQSISKSINLGTKNRDITFIWDNKHWGITISYPAMMGCMPVTSISLINISILDTTLFSDLTGVLKMSFMRLSKKILKKILN